jgi:5'-deoxynucleotidase YfbR-like HD superfamily hydrolase
MYSLLRSLDAASNRAERDQRRRQRELARELKNMEKLDEISRAALEVQEYENHIEVLQTVHKDCCELLDWDEIVKTEIPPAPMRGDKNEKKAKKELKDYEPTLKDKLLRNVEKKTKELENLVKAAQKEDEKEHKSALDEYDKQVTLLKELQKIGTGIKKKNLPAFIEAINRFNHFEEIKELGSQIEPVMVSDKVVEVTFDVNPETIVPKDQKVQLKTGRLSVKPIPVSRFYEIYQDYVSSAVLRVAREIFALVPVELVTVTAKSELLNTKTGHIEKQPILSVAMPRKTLQTIDFGMIDPSDSLANFVHNIKFKKTKGFEIVEKIQTEQLIKNGELKN